MQSYSQMQMRVKCTKNGADFAIREESGIGDTEA